MTTTIVAPQPLPAETCEVPRREALTSMDGAVRALLRRCLLPGGVSWIAPVVELTIYDRVLAAAPAAGGHWTVARRTPVLLLHRVDSYTVTLEFDVQQRPARFRIDGAAVTVSDGATSAALEQALEQARRTGPAITWAPSFMPGLSL